MTKITLKEIDQAYERIRSHIKKTPVLTSASINQICGADLYFKCENFQKGGAFKIRGAANAVFSQESSEVSHGVATHSSGNFAAALAIAASWRGAKAFVVMPENAPQVKKDAVQAYGAEIIFCRPTLQAREETLSGVVDKTGAVFLHPYNDERVIAGQGTTAIEFLQQVKPKPNVIIAPVGGGGMISGTAVYVKNKNRNIRIIGAEPAGADDAYRSLQAGKIIPSTEPRTIADGLLTSLGSLTFPIIREYVDEIVTVSEESIVKAMRLIWQRMKIIVEPSAAVPLAAVLQYPEKFRHERLGIILTGGNVDLNKLPW